MHACAATLVYRKDNSPNSKLGKSETKLLYTLHWLILDAASECEDNVVASATKLIGKPNQNQTTSRHCRPRNSSFSLTIQSEKSQTNYIHSVATIQLFVYLFVPILKSLNPSDLDNLKLNNGLKIWESLWAHRQPSIKIFNTPVKQKYEIECNNRLISCRVKEEPLKVDLSAKVSDNSKYELLIPSESVKKHKNSFGDIYMGKDDDKSKEENSTCQDDDQSKYDFKITKASPLCSKNESLIHKSNSWLEKIAKKEQLNISSKNQNNCNKKYENDVFQISDFETDTIKDNSSVTTEIKKPSYPINSKAPLAHMSSICSFSDSSTPTLMILNNKNSSKSDTVDLSCTKCSYLMSSVKLNLISSYKGSSSFNCPNCVNNLNTNLSASLSGLNEARVDKAEKTNDVYLKTPGKCDQQKKISISTTEPVLKKVTELEDNQDVKLATSSNVRDATFFDVAVMRCLLSPKWHSEGYLWCLEYLSCRVVEITDFTLKEQDGFFKLRSLSIPSDMNDLCILMGVGSIDVDDEALNENKDLNCVNNNGTCKKQNKPTNLNNDFIELINQVYLENDIFNKKHLNHTDFVYGNMLGYSKRKSMSLAFRLESGK